MLPIVRHARQRPRKVFKQEIAETDVGIIYNMSDIPGFVAIITRYLDFVVHEIDVEKNTITLNNVDPPNETAPKAGDVEGHLPCYLHFTLFKKNLDTNHACHVLAKKLNLEISFATAGTQEKLAITTQRVSVRDLRAHSLIELNDLRHIAVGNFEYKRQALASGAFWGNNFEIAVREVTASDETIEISMTALKQHGFVNYFGMHRFGVGAESPRHMIGKSLIKEQYGQALDLILMPRSGKEWDVRQAQEIFARTRNAEAAWECIRYKSGIEAQLLNALKKDACAQACFYDIPKTFLYDYVYSYQSYIWNKVVTARLEEHGNAVLVGDLVSPKEMTEEEYEFVGDEESKPIILTAENVADYTIYDVLLPLPGNEVLYPNNDTHQLYKDVLAEDGLTTECFSSNYYLTGSYRHVARIPKNLSWKTVRYDNNNQDLILSDVDKLAGKTLPKKTGDKKAVVIQMDLGKSSYANMALREVLSGVCVARRPFMRAVSLKGQARDEENAQSAKRMKVGDEDNDTNKLVLNPKNC